ASAQMCICNYERSAMETKVGQQSLPEGNEHTLVEYTGSPTLPLDGNGHPLVEYKGTRHWRSMALDTLRSDEAHRVYDKGRRTILQPCSLTTEGIELAQPAPVYRFLNRGPYKVSSLSKTWDDLDRPRPWIPAHVHRTFHNLTTDDIKGAHPNPKFKCGRHFRCQISTQGSIYVLSYVEQAESPASKEVIEGSFPGWRPAHRRRFGKSVRDLCLQVQDINKPTRRMIRSGNAQAYLEIEGTHPKHLKQFQIGDIRSNHSLQAFDIQGTESGSATWISNVQRRKEEGKERTCTLKHRESAEMVAEALLDSKTQGLEKGLLSIFKQLDRDKSGKLTAKEVHTAFKRLQVELNAEELRLLASAFNTDVDGYVDYRKLLFAASSKEPKKHFNPAKLDSRVVALCLNQWIDRSWPDAVIKPGRNARHKHKRESGPTDVDHTKIKNVKSVNFVSDKTTLSNPDVQSSIVAKEEDSLMLWDSRNSDGVSMKKELPSKSCKFPLQLGLPFWPEERLLQAQGIPRSYFSLPQDYKDDFRELPKNPIKPLADVDKAWEKNVGDTLFTGDGNVVGLGSYMTGYDWSRQAPQTARLPAKKRRLWRCQSLPNFCSILEVEVRMTARSENVSTPPIAPSRSKDSKSPATPFVTRSARRPMSASYTQAGRAGQFCSPRSLLMSPMSSRSSWTPRSGTLSFDCTPRVRTLFGGSISARESLASRNQAERQLQRLQTVRKEDAAATGDGSKLVLINNQHLLEDHGHGRSRGFDKLHFKGLETMAVAELEGLIQRFGARGQILSSSTNLLFHGIYLHHEKHEQWLPSKKLMWNYVLLST
ncbi:hypothetical protein GOP47_0006107, partial [Adiantum capillus-veneris]